MLHTISSKTINIVIAVISVAVPALVIAMLKITPPEITHTLNLNVFPKLHAFINSGTTICLLTGLFFIKNKKQPLAPFSHVDGAYAVCCFPVIICRISYAEGWRQQIWRWGINKIRLFFHPYLAYHFIGGCFAICAENIFICFSEQFRTTQKMGEIHLPALVVCSHYRSIGVCFYGTVLLTINLRLLDG